MRVRWYHVLIVLLLLGLVFYLHGYSYVSKPIFFARVVGEYNVPFELNSGWGTTVTFADGDDKLDVVTYHRDGPKFDWCVFLGSGSTVCKSATLYIPDNYSLQRVSYIFAGRYLYVSYYVYYSYYSDSQHKQMRYRIYHAIYDLFTGGRYASVYKEYDGTANYSSGYYETYDIEPYVGYVNFNGSPSNYSVLFRDYVFHDEYYSSSGRYEFWESYIFQGAYRYSLIGSMIEWLRDHELDGRYYAYRYPVAYALRGNSFHIWYYDSYAGGKYGFIDSSGDRGEKSIDCSQSPGVISVFFDRIYVHVCDKNYVIPFDANPSQVSRVPLSYPVLSNYASHTIGYCSYSYSQVYGTPYGYYFVDQNGFPVSPNFRIPHITAYLAPYIHSCSIEGNVLQCVLYKSPPVAYGFDANVIGVLSYDENVDTVNVEMILHPLVDRNVPYKLYITLDKNVVAVFDSDYPLDYNIPVSTPGTHYVGLFLEDNEGVYNYLIAPVRVLAKPWDVNIYYSVPEKGHVYFAATAVDDTTSTLDLNYFWYVNGSLVSRFPSFEYNASTELNVCLTVVDEDNLSITKCFTVDPTKVTRSEPVVITEKLGKLQRVYPVATRRMVALSVSPYVYVAVGGLIVVILFFLFI